MITIVTRKSTGAELVQARKIRGKYEVFGKVRENHGISGSFFNDLQKSVLSGPNKGDRKFAKVVVAPAIDCA